MFSRVARSTICLWKSRPCPRLEAINTKHMSLAPTAAHLFLAISLAVTRLPPRPFCARCLTCVYDCFGSVILSIRLAGYQFLMTLCGKQLPSTTKWRRNNNDDLVVGGRGNGVRVRLTDFFYFSCSKREKITTSTWKQEENECMASTWAWWVEVLSGEWR